ncbi:MAG: hypothetical protein ABF289_06715 [Clostridiales bacterium]
MISALGELATVVGFLSLIIVKIIDFVITSQLCGVLIYDLNQN